MCATHYQDQDWYDALLSPEHQHSFYFVPNSHTHSNVEVVTSKSDVLAPIYESETSEKPTANDSTSQPPTEKESRKLSKPISTRTASSHKKKTAQHDLFKVPGDSSPSKKVKFCCKTKGCAKRATYAYFSEPDDLPVMCEGSCSSKPII